MQRVSQKEELKYWQAIGRRKTARAIIKLFPSEKEEITINNKTLSQYFPSFFHQKTIIAPLEVIQTEKKFRINVQVEGGGKNSQAEAIRHGIARALALYNPEWRPPLKKAGFLKRDPRAKERKKPGLKRARRAPQWQKR